MKIFIFDQDTSDSRRKWQEMLNYQFSEISFDEETGFHRGGSLLSWESGVILVHQATSESLKGIEEAVIGNAGLSAIVVSASPQTKKPTIPRFYFRRLPVEKSYDGSFPNYFKQFWDDLEKSSGLQPNFSLLEPTAVPESLLAYALAVQYQLKIGNIHELRVAADASYEKLQPYAKSLFDNNRAVSFPEVDVPLIRKFEAVSGDANGIRFKAMRNVIDLLREDL